HTAESLSGLLGRDIDGTGAEVLRLAEAAMSAGVAGVVCSPQEVALVRPVVAGGRIVVPGIRRSGDAAGDQARVATPQAAVAAGATHLVVGRPIIEASDPAEAWTTFHNET
ncbi:MAG TPA: orotidine 5'-phosphate decarboxylase, partial [Gemmatimonadales bacterium]|nr:orotidine 5'-phosphate decarboxylase [Gemmatimonadales bacterium]